MIRKDPATGDIVLSRKPDLWTEFTALVQGPEVPADFSRPE